jgi:bifunctional non-homologous end joining protein LigD
VADTGTVTVGRRQVPVPNQDKVLFPDRGLTKADLVGHYRTVSGAMLPHLRGRPLMLQQLPDGIGGKGFYRKQTPGHFPDWVRRVTVTKEGGTVDHVVCDDEATLVYLAGQACITPHIWTSRGDKPERPDRVVFDLDPSGYDFGAVIATARAVGEVLDGAGLVPFVQTTGSRGLHVVAPIQRRAAFDQVRDFAHRVARILVDDDPDTRTLEWRKANRGERIYLDLARNGYAQTFVAPYGVRALPGAPVATPLDWDELAGLRGAGAYRVPDVAHRLAQREDPWAGMQEHARPLGAAGRRLPGRRRG